MGGGGTRGGVAYRRSTSSEARTITDEKDRPSCFVSIVILAIFAACLAYLVFGFMFLFNDFGICQDGYVGNNPFSKTSRFLLLTVFDVVFDHEESPLWVFGCIAVLNCFFYVALVQIIALWLLPAYKE